MTTKQSTDSIIESGTLPTPRALKHEYPIQPKAKESIALATKQIVDILDHKDPRLLLIVGPCSIHDVVAAEEYAKRLHSLAEEVADTFLVVMRAHFEKPRTSVGWKGLLYDPHLNGTEDMVSGICNARSFLLTLAEMGLPVATEFLDPLTANYIGDLISWACIGARTAESQIHRQTASGLPMPVAFKNNTAGSIDVAINGVLAASAPHTSFGIDDDGRVTIVKTKGNRSAHIVLRGGEKGPNYDEPSICQALKLIRSYGLPQRLIIDCSHDNSARTNEKQEIVFRSVIQQYIDGNKAIRGLILESHLFGGNQPLAANPADLKYAISLTDPCLDWESTERLIRWAYSSMRNSER